MAKARRNVRKSEEVSSSSGTSSSLSSDEEVDARDLKPIRDYLSDRKELARQLFKSVKAEKIEMMLPQTLKKMDLEQLEKWCANELSGMSKSRILSILNGKPMLESSDTSESDDSGPSLEIISDTEEWFTDEDVHIKEEGSVKAKVKNDRTKQKSKSQFHKKNDNKPNHKKVSSNTSKNIIIQKEEPGKTNKEKEGDSLLDLLELEMRARAIRALIRKEEDIIPNASNSAEDNSVLNKNAVAKARQEEMKEKENCRRQLEKIISAQQNSAAEDEDVVLVVQPTPTIELLSSDSENESHSGVRVNKKLENERVVETKENVENLEGNKATPGTAEGHKDSEAQKMEVSKRPHSSNISHTDVESKFSGKRRKTKKKSHTKEQSNEVSSEVGASNTKPCNEGQSSECIKNNECLSEDLKSNEKGHKTDIKSSVTSLNKQDTVKVSGTPSNVNVDDEKSIDLDEIIDLDDYCDDMEDIENNENGKNKDKEAKEIKQDTLQIKIDSVQKSNGTETWASRYYQTDDVQNVIKESKIQSEIRKRLRERQRLSKASTPSNKKLHSSSTVTEDTANKDGTKLEQNPLGSVDEYLALKNIDATRLDSNIDNVGVIKDNETSTNNCTDAVIDQCMHKTIDNDHAIVHPKNQSDNTEINLNHNASVENASVTENENVAS